MNTEIETMSNKEINEAIKEALEARGIKRRWLKDKLEAYGIRLNESMLSNRFRERYLWKKSEIEAINEILNLELKAD